MNEIKQRLEEAFQLLSTISVKGNEVDSMAVARANLRAAYRLLDERKESGSEKIEEVSADG